MRVILGIDPGSRLTGFGVVRAVAGKTSYLASGCIRLSAAESLAMRLQKIYEGVCSIKQAVVGTGRAEKTQVQHMVRTLLALPGVPQADAADALAAALCHAHTSESMARIPLVRASRRAGTRWRSIGRVKA